MADESSKPPTAQKLSVDKPAKAYGFKVLCGGYEQNVTLQLYDFDNNIVAEIDLANSGIGTMRSWLEAAHEVCKGRLPNCTLH